MSSSSARPPVFIAWRLSGDLSRQHNDKADCAAPERITFSRAADGKIPIGAQFAVSVTHSRAKARQAQRDAQSSNVRARAAEARLS
jgi:hypothetical protein